MTQKTYLRKFQMMVMTYLKIFLDDAKDILEKVSNYGGFNPNFDLNTNLI